MFAISLGLRLSIPVISDLLNLKSRSVYYLVRKYHLRNGKLFSDMTDDTLDEMVSTLMLRFPNAGRLATTDE